MRSPGRTPFSAVFRTEVLLNSKRVAPHAMVILFGANAMLWWGWGPAAHYGWATNGEFFIVRIFAGFSFMTLPLFTALIMGDPVIRDFRTGVAPLIFSKPVSRAEYLLGKFFGNFFVLVCCQMAFALTLLLLQGFRTSQMIVQPARVVPYLKHFLLLVVVSHLALAAFYFAVGTLTRNPKIVYGLAVCFYPLYITYQMLLRGLPARWRIALDPLLMNWPDLTAKGRSAQWVNQLAFSYNSDLTANRALMILIAAVCLTILYVRFTRAERLNHPGGQTQTSLFNLSASTERLYDEGQGFRQSPHDQTRTVLIGEKAALPKVESASEEPRTHLKQLIAALGIEFRLLRAERGLVLLMPLAVFLSTLEMAFYEVIPDVSYSAAYASNTAKTLLLFLFGLTVFYTGEAMHRDRETRIEPILWSLPAPNHVLLLSKFLATLLMSFSLIALVALTAIALQILKGEMPVEVSAYLTVYSVILIPSVALMAGVSIALNVLLRDKYLAYAVSIAAGGALLYLYSQGYNHWLYNPVLYQLWTYADLTGATDNRALILIQRIYCLAITCVSLSLAHLCFPRRSAKALRVNGRLASAGWSILIAVISAAIAAITGLIIISLPR